jgi:hypothetical protein
MHWFLAVYYFIPPLLHVSTRVCVINRELLRACLVTRESNAMVGKTLRYTLCVCYVEGRCAAICTLQRNQTDWCTPGLHITDT